MLRVIGGITALMLSASIVTAQQPGTATPDRRGGMSRQNQMSMAMMDSLNQRLDSLVGRMNRASGNQKVQAMAAVINEMVAQRKAMQEGMHQMMGGRDGMMKMMGDSAPPTAGAPAADSAASDTAGHAGHHPPK
jgi:predicted transcriptional regulator